MITWKNIAWRGDWLFFWTVRHVFEICRAFLKELQENGIFEKQLLWTMNVFSAQEDRADENRVEKVSFDMIRDIMQLWGTAGPSKSNETGWLYAWLVSCMLRREPFEKNLIQQSQTVTILAPTIQHDGSKNTARSREQAMWLTNWVSV